MFKEGDIEGLVIAEMRFFEDHRGWLTELYRIDEISQDIHPVMAYISLTHPDVVRGPHEHRYQTDYFCFLGEFLLYLWDNRPDSPTYRNRKFIEVTRKIVIVPPGVVHAYRNIGKDDGLVINLPNRLYRGWGRREEVDEIRHEDDPSSPFKVEVL